jgi:adenosylmethionine-8-amino-7-oxononanoate aminotransferase
LLIADEVAVGFGRTGTMFACEQEDVTPDFLCLAKGLTAGYLPLAATLTTEEVYRAFFAKASDLKTFQHGHTYGGNPLGATVALACLEVFDEEMTLAKLGPKIDLVRRRLKDFERIPHVGDIRQAGLMVGIELVEEGASKKPFPWSMQVGARVCNRARDYGLLIRPIADVVILMPPLSSTSEELTAMLNILERSLNEVLRVEAGVEMTEPQPSFDHPSFEE